MCTTSCACTGNLEYVRYLQQNQGRIYRLVNGQDQVPLLPPLDSYWQTFAGMWCGWVFTTPQYDNRRCSHGHRINNGEVLMQERPKDAATLRNSNWVDHKCVLG